MIDLTFNNGTVERFSLILSQRDYTHLGQISNVSGMKFKANLNGADELSFDVYKVLDGHEEVLWDEIYDLRLVWIRELDEYYEIDVESIDQVYVKKTITAKSLCESELSQTGLHDIEINTAEDIAREDYDPNYPTVFYRPLDGSTEAENKKKRNSSLLHRIMDKVPAYTIGHVDESLMNLQRIFSISDTTLYEFMTGECSEQFNCLFQFDSATRTVSAYDLETTCLNNDCPYYVNSGNEYYSGTNHLRYRGFYTDVCPICGSTNISYYGQDTTVFVSTENLTDEVKFDTDVASLKNCFRLEAGDDNMTAAVINSNPNGTRYIYEFNAESKHDMPEELVNLIDSYDELYDDYNNTENMNLNTSLISSFNTLCNKYNNDSFYHKGSPWSTITTPVYGYKRLIPHYYNCIDFYQYLKSSMMPEVVITERDINDEMTHLLNNLDSTIGVSVQPSVVATVESAITNLCKLYINSALYKVSVKTDSGGWSAGSWQSWTGKITLTSFEDDSVTKTSSSITKTISTDFSTFMDQKISKYIKRAKESTELYDVIKISNLNTFKNELKKYSVARLQSFHDSLAAILGILVEAGQGNSGYELISNPSGNPKSQGWYVKSGSSYVLTTDTTVVAGHVYYQRSSVLYDSFYTPYYNKLKAAETELNTRNQEVELVAGIQDINGNSTKKGVLQYILDAITAVQNALNFKNYIYNHTTPHSYDLYNVYTTYIRESNYSNSNYISDDLNNDQLFENAGRFLELAKDELHKSATYQHSITSNINNLVAIKEFKPLLDKFNLGNWIRIQEDENIYRLRLISYSIDFDSITKLNTEFSDVTITSDGLNDVMSIIKQASSMASSYGYTQQQAKDGADVKTNYIDDWVANGLNSALVRINNNDDEDISIDNTGLLARSYDDIADNHSPEQLRVTHNVIAFTEDNWESVSTALGKFNMTHHHIVEDNYGGLNTNASSIDRYDTYGLVAKAVLSGWIVGSHMEASTIIASHIQAPGNNTYIDMTDITTSGSGREYYIKCYSGGEDKFTVDKSGNVVVKGTITAGANSKIGPWNVSTTSIWYGSNTYGGSSSLYFGTSGLSIKDKFKVDSNGSITATSGKIGEWSIDSTGDSNHKGYLYSSKDSHSSYLSRGFIHLLSSYSSSWSQIQLDTIHARYAVKGKNAAFYVNDDATNLEWNHSPEEGNWVKISPTSINNSKNRQAAFYSNNRTAFSGTLIIRDRNDSIMCAELQFDHGVCTYVNAISPSEWDPD